MRNPDPYLVLCLTGLALLLGTVHSSAQAATQTPVVPAPIARRDGQHDFDFSVGTWKTHILRRLHPLTSSNEWTDYEGKSTVRKIWNGLATLGETEADGPAGHIQALSWRLYNPASHQWTLSFASTGVTPSTPTALSTPTIGEFKSGRGQFFNIETYNGRSILVRNSWSAITAKSIRFEQAFSEDGGKTWEINWKTVDTLVDATPPTVRTSLTPLELRESPQDGRHDFDFNVGVWKTHVKRLTHPLSGSTTWVEYDGTSIIREIWGGRANLVELEVSGSAGKIEGASLRLYNAASHQWSLNFANGASGTLGIPTVGGFKDGRGEFYDQEDLGGRMIFVRFVIDDITPNSVHYEQSFSADGGKSWEVNWIATDTRLRNAESDAGL